MNNDFNKFIPSYINFYKKSNCIIPNLNERITSNDIKENPQYHYRITKLLNKLISMKRLKCILFVDGENCLICLNNHYELNPEIFHVVVICNKIFQDINSELITCMRFNGTYSYVVHKMITIMAIMIQPIIDNEVIFALIVKSYEDRILNNLIGYGRIIIRFIGFRCKSFIYLFLHYLITNGVILEISHEIYNLVQTIRLEDLFMMLKDVNDCGE